jgi:hypothetical protein
VSYQVLARKWRPQSFDEVTGQRHVATALRNAIRLGRVPHAILLAGPRGVGKTTIARIFARCLNCEKGPTDQPCGECPACREISAGASTDVQELDAASRTGVDDVRELIEAVRYAPSPGKHRIFVIDEVRAASSSSPPRTRNGSPSPCSRAANATTFTGCPRRRSRPDCAALRRRRECKSRTRACSPSRARAMGRCAMRSRCSIRWSPTAAPRSRTPAWPRSSTWWTDASCSGSSRRASMRIPRRASRRAPAPRRSASMPSDSAANCCDRCATW